MEEPWEGKLNMNHQIDGEYFDLPDGILAVGTLVGHEDDDLVGRIERREEGPVVLLFGPDVGTDYTVGAETLAELTDVLRLQGWSLFVGTVTFRQTLDRIVDFGAEEVTEEEFNRRQIGVEGDTPPGTNLVEQTQPVK